MSKQVAVIGLGRFGLSLCATLNEMGYDVLAIDREQERVESLTTQLPHVVQADATNEAVLRDLGIKDFDTAIVAMGTDIEASVLTTILLKQLGVRRVIARANDRLHASILERIGADDVVSPEREMGARVAHRLSLTDVSDYMPVVDRYGVSRLVAPPSLHGRTLADLGFGPGGKTDVAVLLLLRKKEVIVSPSTEERVTSGDVLILSGNDDRVERLLNEAKKV